MFKALQVDKDDAGYRCTVTGLDDAALPDGNVTVGVAYSTLNYKDALAITGRAPVIRKFPLIPGIDCAGTVESSKHPDYAAGMQVVLNGWGVGESHSGGLAQRARLNGDWLIPLPDTFTAQQAMAIGTAGYTAMLCIHALERHGLDPAQGDVLVTGASGGVGSIAIALLAKRGFHVVASTGKVDQSSYLQGLGAAEVIDRAQLSAPGKPLARERWAGVVDTVGSHTLANACASTKYGGAVAACGLAGGMDFPSTVAPFILRGVTLLGIESVMAPTDKRIAAWNALANQLDRDKLDSMTHVIGLGDAIDAAADILAGKVRGRLVVDVNR